MKTSTEHLPPCCREELRVLRSLTVRHIPDCRLIILGGSHDIDEKNIQKLIDLRSYYRITGRHPGYKMYNPDDDMLHKKED